MIRVLLDDQRSAFEPGEPIAGEVEWSLDDEPDSLEVRLVWNTSGRAKEHVGVVQVVVIEAPGRSGRRRVELRAPEGPYSFDGQLVSLSWAVEAVAGELADARTEIVIAPHGRPILLHALRS